MLVELGVDALHPLRALIDDRLVDANSFPPLEHQLGRDPRLGKIAVLQQHPQQVRVAAIRLGARLAAAGRLRVRRLRQMRLEARRRQLLDHIPPTGATLDRHRHRALAGAGANVVIQPAAEPLPIRLPNPAPPHLPIDRRVERDLTSMQIEAAYHRHPGPP